MTMTDKLTGTPILIEAKATAVRLALDKYGSISFATRCHLGSPLTSTTKAPDGPPPISGLLVRTGPKTNSPRPVWRFS